MAPPKRPWFRFYVETITDRKIRRLSLGHRWLWVTILCLARQSPLPGWLMITEREPVTHNDLADAAALRMAQVRAGLEKLIELEMIEWDDLLKTWHVTHWDERQFESDETTKRSAKKRSKNNDATAMQRSNDDDATPPEVRGTEESPLPPQSGGTNGKRSEGKNPRALGTNPRSVAAREQELTKAQSIRRAEARKLAYTEEAFPACEHGRPSVLDCADPECSLRREAVIDRYVERVPA